MPEGAHASVCVCVCELHVSGAMQHCRGLCSSDISYFLMDIYPHLCVNCHYGYIDTLQMDKIVKTIK